MESKIRDSVLRTISDDYENLELIVDSVNRYDDPAATANDVCTALVELVKDDLAQAYELLPQHPHATAVKIDSDRLDEQWFYATPKGIEVVRRWNRQLTTDN